MPHAKIEMLHGDCGGICAFLQTKDGSMRVEWGKAGVYRIESDAEGSRDTSGVKLKSSLRAAAGAKAVCDQGEEILCRSSKVTGLLYELDGCPLRDDPEAVVFDIPDCALVGGFAITR